MPLFISDDEYSRCSNDVALVAEKADSFIRDLYNELQTVKAQADAASITAEQTCSLLEQKYISLSQEFSKLESQNAQLKSSLQERLSELAQIQAEKHQLHLKSIEKDGEIERLSIEESELHKSKRQLLELLEHKDLEISEKNATIKSYLDKIVNLTDTAALREARLTDAEAELSRSQAACARLVQEKELIERHNVWLNDELTSKVNSLIELRRTHAELEADMSTKHSDVERRLNECSSSLKWNKERVKELEMKLTSLQQELCSSKDSAAANEERLSAEITTYHEDKTRIKDAMKLSKVTMASTWTFGDFKAAILDDVGSPNISDVNLKLVYEELLDRIKEKEEKEAKKRQRLADDFNDLLRSKKEITTSSVWEDCKPLFEESQEYRSIGEESFGREIFEEYIAHLQEKAKEKERKREEEKAKKEKEREEKEKRKEKERKEKDRDREREKGKERSRKDETESENVDVTDSYGYKEDKKREKDKDRKHRKRHQSAVDDASSDKEEKEESKKSRRHGSDRKKSRKHAYTPESDTESRHKRHKREHRDGSRRNGGYEELEDGELGEDGEIR